MKKKISRPTEDAALANVARQERLNRLDRFVPIEQLYTSMWLMGWSMNELGAMTGVSAQAVSSRISKVREKFSD